MPIAGNFGLSRFFGFLSDDCEIMQFTGLKDKHGKDIYCGDICSMSKKIDMKIIVDYKDAGFGWSDKYNNLAFRGHGYLTKILKDIEVIGNKFDNPEILEEK